MGVLFAARPSSGREVTKRLPQCVDAQKSRHLGNKKHGWIDSVPGQSCRVQAQGNIYKPSPSFS